MFPKSQGLITCILFFLMLCVQNALDGGSILLIILTGKGDDTNPILALKASD